MAASISRLHEYLPRLEGGQAVVVMASGERLTLTVDETGATFIARRRGRPAWRAVLDAARLAVVRSHLIEALDELPELPEPHRFDRAAFVAAVPDTFVFFGNRDPDAVLRASEPALALLTRLALSHADALSVAEEAEAVAMPARPARPESSRREAMTALA